MVGGRYRSGVYLRACFLTHPYDGMAHTYRPLSPRFLLSSYSRCNRLRSTHCQTFWEFRFFQTLSICILETLYCFSKAFSCVMCSRVLDTSNSPKTLHNCKILRAPHVIFHPQRASRVTPRYCFFPTAVTAGAMCRLLRGTLKINKPCKRVNQSGTTALASTQTLAKSEAGSWAIRDHHTLGISFSCLTISWPGFP